MSDRNFRSIADCDGFDYSELIIDLPAAGAAAGQFDDVLKFSNARNGHIGHLVIRTGGREHENAIDFNRRCLNIRIDRAEIEAGAQNAITAKGGCRGLHFGVVEITHAGGHCDVELGNHSDQVYERTTGVTFEVLKRSDGQLPRIRAEYADWPVVTSGAVERQVLISALICLYVQLKHVAPFIPVVLAALLFAGCSIIPHAQKGGTNQTTLGGASPSTSSLVAPENPQTPTTQMVEKTITREYLPPPTAASQGDSARGQPETSPSRAAAQTESRVAATAAAGASPNPMDNRPGAAAPGPILRETIIERSSTQIGSSWKDTARELGVRLGNMRGVMWIGVLLMIAGPVVGWKLGWMTNGLIAGGVGLLLVILAQVVPGNEAWFGLAGLFLIPLVAYAWYHGHHTGTQAAASPTPSPSTPS